MVCSLRKEARLRVNGFTSPAGVDEVGRGCLFGPVTAAAVILPHPCKIKGLRDSKIIAPREREQLAERLKGEAVSWAIAFASVEEILNINILQASRLAMKRAVLALNPPPDFLLIDAWCKADRPGAIYADYTQVAFVGTSASSALCRTITAHPRPG